MLVQGQFWEYDNGLFTSNVFENSTFRNNTILAGYLSNDTVNEWCFGRIIIQLCADRKNHWLIFYKIYANWQLLSAPKIRLDFRGNSLF